METEHGDEGPEAPVTHGPRCPADQASCEEIEDYDECLMPGSFEIDAVRVAEMCFHVWSKENVSIELFTDTVYEKRYHSYRIKSMHSRRAFFSSISAIIDILYCHCLMACITI